MREQKIKILVPIFNATVWLLVAPDIYKLRRSARIVKLLGPLPDGFEDNYKALFTQCGSVFGLCFKRNQLTRNSVNHEVVHLTHGILQHFDIPIDPDKDEMQAYLHAWLVDDICRKLRVKPK